MIVVIETFIGIAGLKNTAYISNILKACAVVMVIVAIATLTDEAISLWKRRFSNV